MAAILTVSPATMLSGVNKQGAGGPARPGQSKSVQDSVNMAVLVKMREAFIAADRDGTGCLEPEEFVSAFKGILQTADGGDEEALKKLFLRVDANCDGTIDWDEFSSYMLLESQGTARLQDFEASLQISEPEQIYVDDDLAHKELILNLNHMRLANGMDRLVTCGRDGLVKLWNPKDLSLLRTINTGKGWVTCAKLMPMTQKLAVSTFSRELKLYDLSSFEQVGHIKEIDYAPLSMDVWRPAKRRDVELVVFGDAGGFVRLYEAKLSPMEDKNSRDRFLDQQLWHYQHHTDWITHVMYVEQLNACVASSLDKTVSLTDAEKRVPLKRLEGHTKGVLHCAWSNIYKFVVTASQDKRVILWNPFSQKPLATMSEHQAGVLQVIVNEADNQILSLSADKTIKVWDIRNHRCLQTVVDREVYFPEDTLPVMVYDEIRRRLVTASVKPKIWPMRSTAAASAAHIAPVIRAAYNSNFDEVVSVDRDGTVSVWHFITGRLRFRYYRAHEGASVTAMAFDNNKRRLITGAEDGNLKVWNFNSGACLSTCKSRMHQEVTSILCTRGSLTRHILAAGWDCKVTFYEDANMKTQPPGRALTGHRSDILAMVNMENSATLVTSSYDGEIWVWNIDSGAVKRRMVSPGLEHRPTNETAVEDLYMLRGRLRSVVVAVGADRYMRFWDVMEGSCLLEVFTGHKSGETVSAVAGNLYNTRLATSDSAGFIKIWDISSLSSATGPAAVRNCSPTAVHCWRGHTRVVTTLEYIEFLGQDYIVSCSADCLVILWSSEGAQIGGFGHHTWVINDRMTWRTTSAPPFQADEADMLIQSQRPVEEKLGRMASRKLGITPKASFKLADEPQSEDEASTMVQSASTMVQSASTPTMIAKVVQASMAERLASIKHRNTMRRSMYNASISGAEPNLQILARAQSGIVTDDDSNSDTSSGDHGSDAEVPESLWLPRFDILKQPKRKINKRGSSNGLAGAATGLPPRPSSVGKQLFPTSTLRTAGGLLSRGSLRGGEGIPPVPRKRDDSRLPAASSR